MAVIFKIKCLECGDKFKVRSLDQIPPDCPLCAAPINHKEMPEVAAPFIPLKGGAHSKAIDAVYRNAETSAEARIEQAVAMTPGSSREDFAHLKVTDYRPNMVEGEPAVRMPETSREFKQNVAALQSGGHTVHGAGVMDISAAMPQFAAATKTGPSPNAGDRARQRLRDMHAKRVDPRMSGAVSTVPTLTAQEIAMGRRG